MFSVKLKVLATLTNRFIGVLASSTRTKPHNDRSRQRKEQKHNHGDADPREAIVSRRCRCPAAGLKLRPNTLSSVLLTALPVGGSALR